MKTFFKFIYFSILLISINSCADTIDMYKEPIENIKSNKPPENKNTNKLSNFQYSVDDLPTNYNPESDPNALVDELGLWMQIDKIERNTRTSGNLLKSKEINAYVNKVFCKVSPEYCNEIRIYIISVPF